MLQARREEREGKGFDELDDGVLEGFTDADGEGIWFMLDSSMTIYAR